MKSICWVCLITASVLISTSALACDKAKSKADTGKDKKITKQKVSAGVTEERALTGSYIKRNVRRSGQITDGPNQVMVLDSEAIRRSGASDVRELLVRRGAVH